MTLSKMTLGIKIQKNILQHVICDKEANYSEFRYAECHCAECRGAVQTNQI
jgi:hypothetical protein